MGKYKTWAIRGNREQYMIDYRNKVTGLCYGSQTGSLLYTYKNLTSADIVFFCELPITQTIEIEGCNLPWLSRRFKMCFKNQYRNYR